MPFEVVNGRALRLWGSVHDITRNVPLMCHSDLDFDTLANKRVRRLASQALISLVQHHLGVRLSVTLQLGFLFLSSIAGPIIVPHNPNELLAANKVLVGGI